MTAIRYRDFNLKIGISNDLKYPVTVDSPAGQASATMNWALSQQELENRHTDLQIDILSSRGHHRLNSTLQEQKVQNFGTALFNALFTGVVRDLYYTSRGRTRQEGMGLRIRLQIEPADLILLPWEFLYDPSQTEYVCLSRYTPIVRDLNVPRPVTALTVTPPLRVLGMIASPTNWPSLNVKMEQERIESALNALKGLVELTWLPGQTQRDLHWAMSSGHWHIFHFIGHGYFDAALNGGGVVLANNVGGPDCCNPDSLSRLLADHHNLRLVLLNACSGAQSSRTDSFSSTAATLVRQGLPAVIAMQYSITDNTAIEFARTFYQHLAVALPVDAAVVEARKAISINSMEWGTPVLYMRTPDGNLFIPAMPATPASEPVTNEGPRIQEQDEIISPVLPVPPRPKPTLRGRRPIIIAISLLILLIIGSTFVWWFERPPLRPLTMLTIQLTNAVRQTTITETVSTPTPGRMVTDIHTAAPLMIDTKSIPEQILLGDSFRLQGSTTGGAKVHVAINDKVAGAAVAGPDGNWRVTIGFPTSDTISGTYTVTAQLIDNDTVIAESAPVLLSVLKPTPTSTPKPTPTNTPVPTATYIPPTALPVIDTTSIPAQILPGDSFRLRGSTTAGARVHVISNNEVAGAAVAGPDGNWRVTIGFSKAGDYTVTAQLIEDDTVVAESEPVLLSVLKPTPTSTPEPTTVNIPASPVVTTP